MAVSCYTHKELIEIARAFNTFIAQNKKVCSTKNDKNVHTNTAQNKKVYSTKNDKNVHTNVAQTKKVCSTKNVCLYNSKPIEVADKSKAELWKSIHRRLRTICRAEYCWIELPFIQNIPDPMLQTKLKQFTFKPKMTKGRYSWLSTGDINNVMRQYEKFDNTFFFFGALPSDFYKYASIDTNLLYKYSLLAVVFNLDEHHQKGSHWVSLVIDNNIHSIEYFDSVGDPPNENIKRFISLIRPYLSGYTVRINTVKHQYKNSECGIYSVFYIIQRLLGYSFQKLSNDVIKDKAMNKFRDHIFRPKN
jgi:hypothetical protein